MTLKKHTGLVNLKKKILYKRNVNDKSIIMNLRLLKHIEKWTKYVDLNRTFQSIETRTPRYFETKENTTFEINDP